VLITCEELVSDNISFFILLWFYLPIIALWLNTQTVRYAVSLSSLKVARGVLVATVVYISLILCAGYGIYYHIRDYIGNHFVDGYSVIYYNDGEMTISNISTSHWYARFGLWLFGFAFFGVGILLSLITWYAANCAVGKKLDEIVKKQERTAEILK
jgi:hypothetical protein